MYINLYLLVGIGAVIFIYLIGATAFKNGSNRSIKTSDASLTCEELEEHARKVAVEHSTFQKKGLSN